VQAAHAAITFTNAHDVDSDCTLVMVTVPDEEALWDLVWHLRTRSIGHEVFREPDLGDELTAVAAVPSGLVKDLPLAFPAGGGETDD
jgi:hypothetical protein